MAELTTITLTGTTESAALELQGKTITRIQMPETWDDADLNFLEAFESTDTFRPLFDANGDRTFISVGADRMVLVDPRQFQSCRRLKVVSSNSQGSARTLRIQVEKLADLTATGGGLQGTVL